jgi:hypothetical protein
VQPKSANRRFLSFKQEFKNLSIAYPIIGNILRVANLTPLTSKTKLAFCLTNANLLQSLFVEKLVVRYYFVLSTKDKERLHHLTILIL